MKRFRTCFGVIFIFFTFLGCVSYPKEIKKALHRSYGSTFSNYSFRGNPIGNFGVGTIYSYSKLKELKVSAGMPNEWLLAHPDTWYADDVDEINRKALDEKIFNIGGLGSIELQENISTKLKLNTSIPNIAQILNAGANIDYSKGVKVTLKAKEAMNRQVNWSEFVLAIKNNKIKGYVKEYLNSGDAVIGCQDIILIGYSAEIFVDQKVNNELYVKLNESIGTVIGSDSELSVNIERTSTGSFIVQTKNNVVAAVLYMRPLTTIDKISFFGTNKYNTRDFETIVVKSDLLKPIEEYITKIKK